MLEPIHYTFTLLCPGKHMYRHKKVAWLFIEYDVARGILKFQCKTWEFRATSYSVNSQGII